jgi:hypothetical protein
LLPFNRGKGKEENEASGSYIPTRPLKIGSWNIKHLSQQHTDAELNRIASVLKRFDLCAVQEVHDDDVCKKLQAKLPGWEYRLSDKVGRGARNKGKARVYEERYAFFFNTATITTLKDPVLMRDGADLLVREPFVGYFKGKGGHKSKGGLDFILGTVHVTFGDKGLQARVDEMASLGRMLTAIEKKCVPEKNIFLAGDFNLPPDKMKTVAGHFTPLINEPDTTTIFGSLYDQFWVPEGMHAESSGVMYIDHEFYPDSELPYKGAKAKAARKLCNKVSAGKLTRRLSQYIP